MLPRNLQPENFTAYPPEARKLVLDHIEPSGNFPLRSFPACCARSLTTTSNFQRNVPQSIRSYRQSPRSLQSQAKEWFQPFQSISISSKLEDFDWINSPAQFIEQHPPISGARTNSMRFAKLRPTMATRLQAAIEQQTAADAETRHCNHWPGCFYLRRAAVSQSPPTRHLLQPDQTRERPAAASCGSSRSCRGPSCSIRALVCRWRKLRQSTVRSSPASRTRACSPCARPC